MFCYQKYYFKYQSSPPVGSPHIRILRKVGGSVTFLMIVPPGLRSRLEMFQVNVYQTSPRIANPIQKYTTRSSAFSLYLPAANRQYQVQVRVKISGQSGLGLPATFTCP